MQPLWRCYHPRYGPQEISSYIHEGAMAFLKREYKIIIPFVLVPLINLNGMNLDENKIESVEIFYNEFAPKLILRRGFYDLFY